MGSQPSKPSKPSVDTNESYKSARNVLEKLALDIKEKATADAKKHENELKGKLEEASFSGAYGELLKVHRYGSTDPCDLYHMKHTNLLNNRVNERNPCHGRNPERFDEDQVSECSKSRIKGNENKNDGGSCAPPRRQHMCDKNLEALNESNTQNVHDLLGNVLVTAKYEGESIVKSHANNGTLNVCTLLARSFADIGDIVRGKDLFLGGPSQEKKKLEENLKKIFENIKKNNNTLENLTDKQIREYWWALNRKEVWKAITCKAPPDSRYFVYKQGNYSNFSNPKCGHEESRVLTNLDYVPQFLRWFEEWAEEFCRKRKIKLENVKKVCRGEYDSGKKRYCSGDGHDCRRTNLERNNIFVDIDCPDCEKECRRYKKWIENQEKEFYKQKQKYAYVINKNRNTPNNDYYKKFYENLEKKNYSDIDNFLESLNEGKECQDNNNIKNKMNFKNLDETFGRLEYCKACPFNGVTCPNNRECTPNIVNEKNNKKGDSSNIDIIINYHFGNDIDMNLQEYCKKYNLFKVLRKQEWNCQYIDKLNRCVLQNYQKSENVDDRISFKVLLERWLKDFLEGYNKSKRKIKVCTKNDDSCIKGCKDKCECVEKWLKKKVEEWRQITQYFNTHEHDKAHDIAYKVKSYFEQIVDYVKKYIDDFENLKTLEEYEDCNGDHCGRQKNRKKKDIVTILLNRLEKQINDCKKNHEENEKKDCMDMPKSPNEDDDLDDEEDESDEEEEDQTPRNNPCVTVGDVAGVGNFMSVTEVAKEMQGDAHTKMLERSVKEGDKGKSGNSCLVGNIKEAKFRNGHSGKNLTNVCDITKEYTNDKRGSNSGGPCTGKNQERFKIGKDWENVKENVKTSYKDVFLPPRREHMCTSNLEKLDVSWVTKDAKYEAKKIKELYKQYNSKNDLNDSNDQATICRAVRYSFADLGDIIRGRDMWDLDSGSKDMERDLKKIFEKIKSTLDKEIIRKYDGDNDHIKFREDWWEANRHQVWRAMKCHISNLNVTSSNGKSSSHCGYSRGTPPDDYIPQRLRWMTEWAEWFCKEQSRLYGEFVTKCGGCKKNVDSCIKNTPDCQQCDNQCKLYGEKINKWQKQWDKIQQKYKELYEEADRDATSGSDKKSTPLSKEDQRVVDFLKQLKEANKASGNTTYATAEGYVHQELENMECDTQNVFCGEKDKKEYAFKNLPNGYDVVCKCKDRPEQQIKKKEVEDACKIVDDILKDKHQNSDIGNCHPKHKGNPYPKWDCTNTILVTGKGECMPPRRIKLCLYFLSHKNERPNLNTQEDLRKAFIKCAAAETFLSWNYYKKTNSNNLNEKLREGTIPSEFLRSMFYTFGDYRDFLFGTDISKSNKHTTPLKANIDRIFNDHGKSDDKGKRETWWKAYGPHIWKGMLCALSYDTTQNNVKPETRKNLSEKNDYSNVKFNGDKATLEEFAKTPQFLRWFTEWGEHYCKEYTEQYGTLRTSCENCDVDDNGICNKNDSECTKCSLQCTKYKEFINQWKDNYNKQKSKFYRDKDSQTYNNISDAKYSKTAREYLKKQLEKIFCENNSCSCMNEESKESKNTYDNTDMPKSLDEKPEEIRGKCDCKDPIEELPNSSLNCVDKSAFELYAKAKTDVEKSDNRLKENFEKEVFTTNNVDNWKNERICEIKKDKSGKNHTCDNNGNPFDKIDEWDCKNGKIKVGNEHICLPPRRQYMCTKLLEKLDKDKVNTTEELFKKVLLTAAYEGKHIMDSWNTAKEPKKKTQICDAMKYSFADLGDIIRGSDNYKDPKGINELETKLNGVFQNVKKVWVDDKGKKYKDKYPNLESFRSDWWDANRESVWKAMTCSAPKEANIFKHTKNKITEEQELKTLYHCGHNSDPPVDDYIPQLFRWMKEWSENYCNAQNNKLSIFKDCENCKKKNGRCEQKKHGSCKECKKKCDDYKKFVEIWETQYDKLEKAYKELYTKAKVSNRKTNDVDEYTKKFVQKLETNCKIDESNSVDKYLDKGNNCKILSFQKNTPDGKNYAFEKPPKRYKENCECANNFEEVDQCPVDEKECNKYVKYPCIEKYFNKSSYKWRSDFVKKYGNKYESVIVPPRRKELCLSSISIYRGEINDEKEFQEYILYDASNEAKYLWKIYNEDKEKALEAMKYSFADIGNVVKGDDMYDDGVSDKINDIFEKTINKGKQSSLPNDKITRKDWWEKNKHKVWNVMMCQYKGNDKKATSCPKHDNIDKEHQFLRWFQEWTENFCNERQKLYDKLNNVCKIAICNTKEGKIDSTCTEACKKYSNYISTKQNEYQSLQTQYYMNYLEQTGNMDVHELMKNKCKEDRCDCLYKYTNDENNWKNPYDSLDDNSFKSKCDCKKSEVKVDTKTDKGADPLEPDADSSPVEPQPIPSLPQSDQPTNNDIWSTTIPLGLALALTSMAFIYLRKKSKSPVDLFSVIDIPKGDYGIPTLKSSNRYIPYASDRYKGKTYIYMEGDSGDEKYIGNISSSDITSSESEYEEMDINDLYPYTSPKYKTLIEVVLEPSKGDIQIGDIESDTPKNKFTDEQWNHLKEDFISGILENAQKDLPKNNIKGNIPKNTQLNTLYFDHPEEKPFIISIHDRNLYSGEECSYNINMTNNDDIPISDKNDTYSGIDLINDSLEHKPNIDIYDELLKRKENELFGTKHAKQTTTNSVAKEIFGNPIMNQINLLHKWLDRHRNMCENWENKEDILNKLKEEWEKDNNSGDIPSDNHVLNTNASIEIDMDDPKTKNEFTNIDTYPNNSPMDTILDDMEDDIYYDVNDNDDDNDQPSVYDIPMDHNKVDVDVPKKVHVEMKILNNTFNGSLEPEFPISDVWNI
ncbi:erythrocyte membrane protein 1 [Plasmodium falciparum IGH-CR14]|uniref:Erythrocyte membrane protein 1 n=1 Tax=Plasmodium falciparum IGH-CR14 TaxID=580059 RepID=A0A0L1I3I7_PLAFA|nr:erythrocyte membrane protein 1 [Plasmodium falciparum IGH-CR14]